MDKRLKFWEFALLVGLILAVIFGVWLGRERQALADSLIRFHVLANSDSDADQALKLKVRDRVLEQAKLLYPENATLEEARSALEENLSLLAETGRQVVEEQGYGYPVSARMEQCWFPTKQYDDFSLPAGIYTALRIVIGEGEGQNWWCVAFPPLCLGAASQTIEDAAEAGYFTSEQAALVTEASEGYVLKFKSLELLGQLQKWLD
jgi:stage II sporulation protein R